MDTARHRNAGRGKPYGAVTAITAARMERKAHQRKRKPRPLFPLSMGGQTQRARNLFIGGRDMLRKCPDLMTVKDMQNVLNIGRSTAYKLLESGEIPALKIGRMYRIPKPYLATYIKNNA